MSHARSGLQGDGLLASQHLRTAISAGWLASDAAPIPESNVQPASLDLRLGAIAYRLQCSFLPSDRTVEEALTQYSMGVVDLSEGGILERNRPYLVELMERADLPSDVRGKANPKSSTGRLDVFTRLLTNHAFVFDHLSPGYSGPMYVEIVPRSFTVEVRQGDSLNQVRLMRGATVLTDTEIQDLHRAQPVLYRAGIPVPSSQVATTNGLFLGVDIRQATTGDPVGYRARGHSGLIRVSARGRYEVDRYWEYVYPDGRDFVVLNPETFYLLMSEDEVSIPPGYAAEMTAYDPTSGELRTHYAGFFDPGFGFRGDLMFGGGTRAALEVRAHDVPFAIEHGQKLCRLGFERLIEPPDVLYGTPAGSSYHDQRLAVGKQFLKHDSRAAQTAPEDRIED